MLRRHSQVVWLKRLPLAERGLQSRDIQLAFEREMTALRPDLHRLQLDVGTERQKEVVALRRFGTGRRTRQ